MDKKDKEEECGELSVFIDDKTCGKNNSNCLYDCGECIFWILFILYNTHFLVAFVSDFPYLFQRVINSLVVGKMPDYVLLKSFFSQLVILGLILFFFYNLLKPLLNNLKRKYIEKNQR